MKKYGLYIHIPFCVRKCAYCDFPSYSGMENVFGKYVDAVLSEAEKYKGLPVDTVFTGGGTPTCLDEYLLEKLYSGINSIFDIQPGAEFSAEANPGTVSENKLSVMRASGVNRLSVGVQSFDDDELKILGRIHSSKTALETIENAQKYFDNINIDIMTALPGQTYKKLSKTIKTAVDTGIQHLSCYSLIIEEGTPFYDMYSEGKLGVCSEDEDREMFGKLCAYLKEAGFERYEISNFAKPGRRCRHNLKYWNTEEYIGIGAAAHSYFDGKRFNNSADVRAYIEQPGKAEDVVVITEEDKISEYVMMSLRTSEGVKFDVFSERFGVEFEEVFRDKFDKFKNTEFVKITEKSFSLTEKGFDVSNAIMCEFV